MAETAPADPAIRVVMALKIRDEGDVLEHNFRFHHNILHGKLSAENTVELSDNYVGEFDDCFKDPERADFAFTQKGEELFGTWRKEGY